jgi:hypothetical protein
LAGAALAGAVDMVAGRARGDGAAEGLAPVAPAGCTLDTAEAECTVTAGCVVMVDGEGAVTGAVVTGAVVTGGGAAAAGITGDTVAQAAGEAQEAGAARIMVAEDRRAVVPAIKVAVAGAARDSGAAVSAAGGRAIADEVPGAKAVGAETDEAMVRATAGDAIAVKWDLAGQALVAGNSEEEDLPAEILETGILEAGDLVAADLARRESVARAMTDSAAKA